MIENADLVAVVVAAAVSVGVSRERSDTLKVERIAAIAVSKG